MAQRLDLRHLPDDTRLELTFAEATLLLTVGEMRARLEGLRHGPVCLPCIARRVEASTTRLAAVVEAMDVSAPHPDRR